MTEAFEYQAFISYSHRDRTIANWLHKALESYRVPSRLRSQQAQARAIPRRIGKIFKDREELSASGSLTDSVDTALRNSCYLIVVCSPAAAASTWVNEEIRRFKMLRSEDCVLPLIVNGEPHSADPSEECFPDAVRFAVNDEGKLSDTVSEPIASDLRADGRRRSMLKIASALLGVKLDDLIQRDHQRQVRRWAAISAASVAGLLMTTALAVFAYKARIESEFQRGQAEGLIEFMLTDLREKLEPVGRLDVLDTVGLRAQDYYANLPRESLDDSSLARSSRALILIGEIRNLQGDLEQAKAVFEESYRTTNELLSRAADDPQRLYDHAQSAFWLGYLDWARGNTGGARDAFVEYQSLSERLVAIDPRNDEWIAELGHSRRNLGVLLLESGESLEAERVFRLSLEGFGQVAGSNPGSFPWQLEVGQGYAWLADALYEQRRFEDARDARNREREIYEAILARDERNNQVSDKIVVTYKHLGELALAMGQTREAQEYLEHGVSRSRQLLEWEPDNTLWMEFACTVMLDLAALQMSQSGSYPHSIVTEAIGIAEELNQRDSGVLAWRVDMLARAQLYAVTKLAPEQRWIELDRIVRALIADFASNPVEVQPWLAEAYRARALHGDPSRAMANWQWLVENLDGIEELPVSTETILAEALLATGEHDRAGDITRRLQQAGYAHPDFVALTN